MRFRNKTCVVVGASGGIGRALVQELYSRKARVVRVAHSDRLSQPRGTLFVDLAKPSTIRRLATTLCKIVDKIDYLFNVSGIVAYKPLLQMSQGEIETVLNTNLSGAITLTQQCLPLMRRDGFVVYVGSMAGVGRGHKLFAVYAASKQGLIGFSRAMSAEYPRTRFIVVIPAGVDTDIAARAIGGSRLAEKFEESNLDAPEVVVRGLLDKLGRRRSDVRLFPTPKANHARGAITR